MSVTSVALQRGLSAKASSDYRVTYTTKWKVITDDVDDGTQVIMNAPGLPQIWEAYTGYVGADTDLNAFAQDVTVTQSAESGKVWDVIIEWRPLEPGKSPGDPNPLNLATQYSIETVSYSEPVEKDRDGDPIANAANQTFDEPLMEERTRMVLVAQRPMATLQEVIDLNLIHAMTTNSDTFYTAAADTCLCRPIQSGPMQTVNDVEFYMATFRIEFNENTWDRSIVNRGLKHYRSAADKTLIDAKDEDGNLMAEPVLLATDGSRLGDNVVGNTLDFSIKSQTAFSGLGI